MYGAFVAYKSYAAKGDDVPSAPSATRVDADDDASPRAVKSAFVDAFDPDREETKELTPPSPPPEVFQSPENQARIYEAMETKAKAQHTRDEMLSKIEDSNTRAKARIFADAAIAGVKVKQIESEIAAADESSACEAVFAKLHLDGNAGLCEVTPKEQPALAKVEVERTSSVRAQTNPATSSSPSPSSSSSPEGSDDEKDRELAETKAELEKLKAQLREKEEADAESYNDELEEAAKGESKASAASPKKAKKKAPKTTEGADLAQEMEAYEDQLERAAHDGSDPEMKRSDGLPTEAEKAEMAKELKALEEELYFDGAAAESTGLNIDIDTPSIDLKMARARLGTRNSRRLLASVGTADEPAPAPETAPAEEDAEAPEPAPAGDDAEAPEPAPAEEDAEAPEPAPAEEDAEAPEPAPAEDDAEAPEPAAGADAEASASADAESPAPASGPESTPEPAPEPEEEKEDADAEEDDTSDGDSMVEQYEDELASASESGGSTGGDFVDFVVSVMLSPADVPEEKIKAAVSSLKASGVPTHTKDLSPLKMLKKMDAVSEDAVNDLKRDAEAAVEAKEAVLYPPPPNPSPPPPQPFYPTAHAPPATPWPPEPPNAPPPPPPRPHPPPPPPPIDVDAAKAAMFSHAPPPPINEEVAKAAMFSMGSSDDEDDDEDYNYDDEYDYVGEDEDEDEHRDTHSKPRKEKKAKKEKKAEEEVKEEEEEEEEEEEAYSEDGGDDVDEKEAEEEAKTGRKETKSSSKKSSAKKSSSKRGDDETGRVWWYDGKEKKTSHSASPKVPTTPPEIPGEVDADENEGAAVDYYEYETVDPAIKARERREVEAERLASSASSSSRRSGKGHSAALAAARANLNKAPPPTMYPSPPPPEPPDYSDIIEAASLAMNEGVGIHSAGDAQMKLIANEILLMENEIGVNKFNHLFEAYSQPGVTFGEKKRPRRAGPMEPSRTLELAELGASRETGNPWTEGAGRLWAARESRRKVREADAAVVNEAMGLGAGARRAREQLARQLDAHRP